MNGEYANMGISGSQEIPSNEASAQATKVRRTRTPRGASLPKNVPHTEKPQGTPLSQAAVARPSGGWGQPPSLRLLSTTKNAAFPSGGGVRPDHESPPNADAPAVRPYRKNVQHTEKLQGTPLSQAAVARPPKPRKSAERGRPGGASLPQNVPHTEKPRERRFPSGGGASIGRLGQPRALCVPGIPRIS